MTVYYKRTRIVQDCARIVESGNDLGRVAKLMRDKFISLPFEKPARVFHPDKFLRVLLEKHP